MLSKLNLSAVHRKSVPSGLRNRVARPARAALFGRPGERRNAFAILILGLLLLSGTAKAGSEGAEPTLDLNRATAEQLEALPGIGEVKAAAILAVRDARGGFESIDELESVRGIGPSLAAKLRPMLKVDPKARESARSPAK